MKDFFLWPIAKIKMILNDLYETWSNKDSKLSSKRIERTLFTATSVGISVGTFIFLYTHDRLTSMDCTVIITPLLIAAGYNMSQTQKEKKENKEL